MSQSRRYQYFSAFGVSLTAMANAVALFWSAPILPKLLNHETSINITSTELSWMMSIISPGILGGSLMAGTLSDIVGRRLTLLGSAVPFLVGTILILIATSAWVLYLGRIFWGVGVGLVSTVSSIYISEIADKEIRGRLTVGTRIMFNFGATVVLVVGSFVSYQALCYFIIGIICCYFVVCWWIPETPYYHLKRGRVYRARREILKLKGMKNGKEVDEILANMRADVKNDMMRSSSVKELFTGRQYRKAILISVGIRVTQVFTGSIPIQQYLGAIILDSKLNMEVSTGLIVFGVVRFLVGFLASAMVDRLGRRPLLIYSYIGAGIMLSIIGIYFFNMDAINNNENLKRFNSIVFVFLVLFKIIANLGFDILIFVLPGEIFPLNVRATAMGVFNIFSAFATFAVVRGYQILKDSVGLHGVFWSYAFMAFCGAAFSYFIVIETKGKSLREIQMELQGELYSEAAPDLKGQLVNEANVKDDTIMQVIELKELKTENDELLNR